MITTLTRRVFPLLGLAALMVGFMWQQRVPPAHGDMWFHLRLGQEFLDGWSPRDPGHLAPFDSADWTPTQWLTQVAMAWGVERGGVTTVVWATGVVVVVIIASVYLTCRRVAAPLPATLAVTLGIVAASPGFSARPQMLSYLFVVVTLAAWLASSRDGRPRYWLLAIAWVWPMCHGLWPVGLSISVGMLAGIALERRFPPRVLVRLGLVVAGSVVASALTPVGLEAYRSLLVVGTRTEYFAEWGAPVFTSPTGAILAFMLVVVVISGLRRDALPWTDVVVVALAIAWSLYSLRTTVVGSLLLTPVLAATLARLVPAGDPVGRAERVSLGAMTLASCGILAVMLGIRPSPVVPRWVDARLDEMPPATRILNDWDTGSYFIYRHSDLAWAMHGYGDVFTDAEIRRNFDLVRLNPGWKTEVRNMDVDMALVDPGSPLGYALQEVEGWTVEQSDERFALLTPPSGD